MTALTQSLSSVDVSYEDQGEGRPILLLHGGAGPQSVAGFARLLAARRPARVITPTHPGFGGTPRPGSLTSVAGLAALYAELLEALDLDGVTVVGNSIGGWITAEMALRGDPRIDGVVLVDAVGIAVDGHPVAGHDRSVAAGADGAELPRRRAVRRRPGRGGAAQWAGMAADAATLAVYGDGPTMADPGLRSRLAAVDVPALVLWGESDGVVDEAYGRAYAAAIRGARFELLPGTGHVPQLETPELLLEHLWRFVATHGVAASAALDRLQVPDGHSDAP